MELPPLPMVALTSFSLLIAAWVCSFVVSSAAEGPLTRSNRHSGIRLAPLLRSDEAWQEGHRAAQGPATATAWAVTVAVGVSAVSALFSAWLHLVSFGAAILILLIGLAVAVRRAGRAAAGVGR